MDIILATLVLLVAAWQLYLQRKEIAKGNELEKLKIAICMIQGEIDLREKIIADKKCKPKVDWDSEIIPHVTMVNSHLRPSLRSIQGRIIKLYGGELQELKEMPKYFYE